MIGGMVLHDGSIAEMKTGEGKTLMATLPIFLNSLAGDSVHLVTVNDYLAKRDAEWMKPIYDALGVTVGVLQNMQSFEDKQVAYAADVTYGTNSEFGFDYLRDNMASSLEEVVQRGHPFGIVDEVDNILIDEARTPLIISGAPEEAADLYRQFARLAPTLKGVPKMDNVTKLGSDGEQPDYDYEFDEKHKTVSPTERGVAKAESFLGIENMYLSEHGNLVNHLIQALKSQSLYTRDKDYAVIDGEVMIIDEFTGRILEGRRWSEGLHQAVEAKERVGVREENQTLATITLQNYFRMYDKLAGMTGTALTEANEFIKIYKLQVVDIPTNQPMVRADHNDQIYKTKDGKWDAVLDEIKSRSESGQPVLVGHDLGRVVGEAFGPAAPQRRGPRGAEREARARGARGRDDRRGGADRRSHDRHEHGRPRRRHHAGRQRRAPHARGAAKAGRRARRRVMGRDMGGHLPARRGAGRDRPRAGEGAWRPVHPRHRASRVAAHRQSAARPRRAPGRPRRVAFLPVRRGRSGAPVRG